MNKPRLRHLYVGDTRLAPIVASGLCAVVLAAGVYLLLGWVLADVKTLRATFQDRAVSADVRVSYSNGDMKVTFVDPILMTPTDRQRLAMDVAQTSGRLFDLDPDAHITVRFVRLGNGFLFWRSEELLHRVAFTAREVAPYT